MISMNEKRFDSDALRNLHADEQSSDDDSQQDSFGNDLMARVKKLAVEKPLVVVAAGLAVGVLSGLILKRK